jgi:hypothetical protein
MICPHCKTGIHATFQEVTPYGLVDKFGTFVGWKLRYAQCPECRNGIFYLGHGTAQRMQGGGYTITGVYKERLVEPLSGGRPCPPQVPVDLANDFLDAVAVLPLSPQASAALSRRSLQHILREYAGTTKKDLAPQIAEVLETNILPSSLASQLDAVRNIGNFAAHPQKSTATGEIIPVEPEEAEWNLDILEELFDHFFVKPAVAQARKDELNKKLADAGKPQLP